MEGAGINAAMRGAMAEIAKTPDPVPGNNGEALARIVAFFQAEHSDAWEELRLCPLQHGLQDMVERLK
ncbi:hypothetical protein K7W03_14395 [Sphingobium sp. PNB]|uniref:hypothetical protein n=1 Tax=Sphingobium sp. PNB TaxID=863934 RepID=UPI001CA3CC1C|nr:hypothetical protein [Sphingobium sp. PNB]MCB4860781.1 hypothetical protein [Sphingobium sp. PNB]